MGSTDKLMNPAKRKTRSNLLETRIVLAQLARKRTRSHDATLPKKPINEPKFYFPKDMVEDLDEVYDFYELGATCSPIVKKDAQKRRKQNKIEMNIVETRAPDGMNHVPEIETHTKQEGKNTEMKKVENEGDEEGNSKEEIDTHAYVTEAGQNKMEVETTSGTSGYKKEMYEIIDGIANSSVSDIDDLLGRLNHEPPMLGQDQPAKPPVVEDTCTLPPPCTQQSQPEPLESGVKAPTVKKDAQKRRRRKKIEMDIVATRAPDGTNFVPETETDTKQEGKNTEMKKDEEGNSNEETETHAYVTEAGQNKMEVETTSSTSGYEKGMYEKIDGIANSSVSDIDDLLGRMHDEPPTLEQEQPIKPPVVEDTCTLPPPCTQQSQPEPLESGVKDPIVKKDAQKRRKQKKIEMDIVETRAPDGTNHVPETEADTKQEGKNTEMKKDEEGNSKKETETRAYMTEAGQDKMEVKTTSSTSGYEKGMYEKIDGIANFSDIDDLLGIMHDEPPTLGQEQPIKPPVVEYTCTLPPSCTQQPKPEPLESSVKAPIAKKDALKRRKRKKIEMDIVETRAPAGMHHVPETETDMKQEWKNTEMKKDEERNSNEETVAHAYVTEAGQNKMEVETTSSTFGYEKEMYEKIDVIANSSVSYTDDLLGRMHDEPPTLGQDQPIKPPVVEDTCTLPPPCTMHSQAETLESGVKRRSSYRPAKKATAASRNSMDTNMFIDILTEHVKMGTLRKSKFTTRICNAIFADLSKRTSKSYNNKQIRKNYYRLRKRYTNFERLTGYPEFAWDSTMHSLTADRDVWDEFVKAHSWAKPFRKIGCPDYSKLCTIFGDPQLNQTKPRACRQASTKVAKKTPDASLLSSMVDCFSELKKIDGVSKSFRRKAISVLRVKSVARGLR